MQGMVQQQIPGQRPIMRAAPQLRADQMTTYGVQIPKRRATCKEVDCPHYLKGWSTTVATSSQDESLIRASGRRWSNMEPLPGGFRRYTFPAGQACFAASRHRVAVDSPLFYKRGGDWRAIVTQAVKMRPSDWVDDFANHQQALADKQQEG